LLYIYVYPPTPAQVPGTPGADLTAPLAYAPGDLKLVKTRYSAFFGTPLDAMLRRMGCGTVTLCGVQTPNCIRGTAWDVSAADPSLSLRFKSSCKARLPVALPARAVVVPAPN
jgi:nicotinamidase-related amidase